MYNLVSKTGANGMKQTELLQLAGTNNYGGYYHKDETNNTDINVIKNSTLVYF